MIINIGRCPYPCHFLFLDKKKVTKEKSRLQRIFGLLFFSLPAQYNSSSFVLLKQYCLLKAYAAILKIVALSQNSLRPFEIQLKNSDFYTKEYSKTNRRKASNAMQIFFGNRLTFLRLPFSLVRLPAASSQY